MSIDRAILIKVSRDLKTGDTWFRRAVAKAESSSMSDESMVERVAKALWDSEPTIFSWGPQERHRVSYGDAVARNLAGVHIFRALSRAAIAAMRYPTKAMVEAGDAVLDDCKDGGYESGDGDSCYSYEYIISGAQTTIFQAMIDAALAHADPDAG